MGLIDSHAHLTYPELAGQLKAVVQRCEAAGVDRILTIGTDLEDARAALQLSERHPNRIYAAAGFHPHKADTVKDEELGAMIELWSHPKIVAIGEIGLDYHYDLADKAAQRAILARQLAEAQTRALPIIVHCREAFPDTIRLLEDHGFNKRRVVFHCFTGTEEEAASLAEHDWRISFTGIVTFKNSGWLQSLARAYPADQLMVETDAPYLSPVPVRGKKPNEPAHVVHIARFLAELRDQTFDEIVSQTSSNTCKFFGI